MVIPQPAKDGDKIVRQWNETRIAPSEYLVACKEQRDMQARCNKGQFCPYVERPLFCQEINCLACEKYYTTMPLPYDPWYATGIGTEVQK